MEQERKGEKRRKQILQLLRESSTPLSGTAIGRLTGVSRQMVVQDMALLRGQGHPIAATPRGYVLDCPREVSRLFKVCHNNEQTEEELNLVVDLGGWVEDVIVNHRAYGRIVAPLEVRNRRDVQNFMEKICSGKSSLLLNITAGYHFHHIGAESEQVLDEIQQALKEKGFLAELLEYERDWVE